MDQVGMRELRHRLRQLPRASRCRRALRGHGVRASGGATDAARVGAGDAGSSHRRWTGVAGDEPRYLEPATTLPRNHRDERHGGAAGRASERRPLSSIYLDASAITKLVIAEAATIALRERVTGQAIVTSRVAIVEVVVEVVKAVARANPTADPQPILALLSFIELDADLARISASTGATTLRALDAIHVASALRLGPEVDVFVTYDSRQAAAALEAGLRVDAPAAP